MAPVLQCMALFPCNRFPWKFHKQVGGRNLLQLAFLPLLYSNRPPACNKYIANIIAAQLSFVLANQRRVSSIIFRHGKGIEIIGESCNDAVARSIVGKQLPPGTLEEEKPLFLQNSQNKQVYTPFRKLRNHLPLNIPPSWKQNLRAHPFCSERDVWERGRFRSSYCQPPASCHPKRILFATRALHPLPLFSH